MQIKQNNNQNDIDEMDAFSQQIDSSSVVADPKFKSNLRKKFVLALEQNPQESYLIFKHMYAMSKKKLIIGSGILLSALFATVAVTYVLLSSTYLRPADKSQEEIFAAILNARGSQDNKLAAQDERIATTTLIAPLKDKTFTYNQNISTSGPKAANCPTYMTYGMEYANREYYSYYSKDAGNYSKSTLKGQNGTIYNYSLGIKDVSYEYNGGSFAVKMPNNIYRILEDSALKASTLEASDDSSTSNGETSTIAPEPTTETPGTSGGQLPGTDNQTPPSTGAENPVSSPVVTPEPEPALPTEPEQPSFKIEDYFGANAKVLGIETIDGKDYYVVTWTYDIYCSTSSEATPSTTKIWVDKDNFSYKREELFLGDINEANRIVTNTYKNEESTKEFSEVEANFRYDLNVQTRDVDPTEYEVGSDKYKAALVDSLKAKSVNVLAPQDAKFVISTANSNDLNLPNAYAYRSERNYYSSDSVGDKMFEESKSMFNIPKEVNPSILNAGFNKGEGDRYTTVTYDTFATLSDAEINQKVNSDNSKTPKKITLSIGGQNVEANLYDHSTKDGESKFAMYAVVFKYNNQNYVMWFSGEVTEQTVTSTKFNAFNPNTESGLNDINNLMKAIKQQNPIIAL